MTSRPLISLSLLLLSWQTVRAQLVPAADFFHEGAQSYITNNLAKARESVDQGLKFYPDDSKLKKLDELLKQQSQQQQQKQQQNQQKQSQQNQQQAQNQKQEQKDRQKADQSQDKQDQKNAQQRAKAGGEQNEQKQDEQKKQGEMSPQEAKRLLDSQKNDELLLPVSRKEKNPADQKRTLRDW